MNVKTINKKEFDFLTKIKNNPEDNQLKITFSDWLAKQGRKDLSFAYFWAAKNSKHPVLENGFYHWGSNAELMCDLWRLPNWLYFANKNRTGSPTIGEAFEDLADKISIIREALGG